jgi:hypothetical protein
MDNKMAQAEKTIRVYYSGWDENFNSPSLTVKDNHEGIPAVYFSRFDATELCDGFTLEEMKGVQLAINGSVGLLELEEEKTKDKNQMSFDFFK